MDINTFWSKVSKPNEFGCLLWLGEINNSHKYGRLYFNNGRYYAHRVAFYLYYNRWPKKGKVLAHLCEDFYDKEDNTYRRCINIEHLLETSKGFNQKMAYNNGRRKKINREGLNNNSVELTEDCVRWIRFLWGTGDYTYKNLYQLFDISEKQIRNIVNYISWKHI